MTVADSLGTEQWRPDVGPGVKSRPVFAQDGTIYVTAFAVTDSVTAINADQRFPDGERTDRAADTVKVG